MELVFFDPLFGCSYPTLVQDQFAPLVKTGDLETIAAPQPCTRSTSSTHSKAGTSWDWLAWFSAHCDQALTSIDW